MAICWIGKIVNANLTGTLTFQCYELNRRAVNKATGQELGPNDQITLAAGDAVEFTDLAVPWGMNDQRLIVTSDVDGKRTTMVYDQVSADDGGGLWDWMRVRDPNGTVIVRTEVGTTGDCPLVNHSDWELRLEPDGNINMLRLRRDGLPHDQAVIVGEVFLGIGLLVGGIAIAAGGSVIGSVFGADAFVEESIHFGAELMALAVEDWIGIAENSESAIVVPAKAVSAARLNVAAVFSPARGHSEVFCGSGAGTMFFIWSNGGNWAVDTQSLGGFGLLAGPISAVFSETTQHPEAFYRSENGFLRFAYLGNGWALKEFTEPGRITGDVSAVYSPSRGNSEVYFRPDEGHLHFLYNKDGSWVHDGLAFKQGPKVLGAISAVYAPQRSHSEVFYHGLDGYLHYFYVQDGAWAYDGNSFKQGGRVAGDVAAVFSTARNHSEVFFRGEDGYLHFFYVGASGWAHDGESFKQAGRVAGNIAAVYSPVRNHSEVCFRGEDGFVHYFYLDGDHWVHSAMRDAVLGAVEVAGPVTAVFSPVHQHTELYYRGKDGNVHYLYVADGHWQQTDVFEGAAP